MATYTPQEYANMHYIYGECRGNGRAAARLYRERYPRATRYPDHRVIINVHRSLCDGRFPNQVAGEGRPVNDFIRDEVLEAVSANPSISVRGIEADTGIPKSTAHSILQKEEYHPYHVQRVQSLLPRDYPSRVAFCETILQKHREDENFIDKILWSDESTFKKDGYMNLHNLHEWHVENPHLMREDRSQYRFKVNMWTGILCGNIIGPFEMPENLTGESYLNFLQNDLPNLLEETPPDMWFQHDGCPAHFRVSVREFLDEQYPNRWIGRSGTIPWPARSPDLNPLDFFFWGTMKELVYAKPINDIADLREKITQAVQVIRQKSYSRNIKRSFLRRVRACIAAGGQHFEHLL